MAANICNICGANLEYRDGRWRCPACLAYKSEDITNEEVNLLANAAQKLRLANFDNAEELYQDIIAKYPNNSEAHWGLVLARYEIKYEQDYNGKSLPTCYRKNIKGILDDKNYLEAIRLCKDTERKQYYQEQGKLIESIRNEWVERTSKESQFDIFLCYKESDKENNIERTDDSYEVADLYTHLSGHGYRVFFSRESLREKISEKYEANIYAAINSAPIMIVYGSKEEYFTSSWMKNEWTRFLKRQRDGEKVEGALVVAYDNLDPANLPRPLNIGQALNARSKTFYGDLEKHIEKILRIARKPQSVIERVEIKGTIDKKKKNKIDSIATRELGKYSAPILNGNDESIIKTARRYLKESMFDLALQTIQSISNQKSAQVLMIKLLVSARMTNEASLLENVCKIQDVELLRQVIESSSRDKAIAIIDAICQSTQNIDKEYTFDVLQWIDFACGYQFDGRQNYIKSIIDSIENIDDIDKRVYLFDCIIKYVDRDIDKRIDALLSFANGLQSKGKFDLALKYYNQVLDIEEGNLLARWGAITSNIGATNPSQIESVVYKIKDFKQIESMLSYSNSKQQKYTIDIIVNAVIECSKRHDSIERIPQLDYVFECAIKYYPKDSDDELILKIMQFAESCKNIKSFEVAEKYFAMALSLNEVNHKAYWGLLQAKLHCRTNAELIEQDKPISNIPEYNSALTAAGDDDRSADMYISVCKNQINRIEAKKVSNAKKKKAKKATTLVASIVAFILVVTMVLVSCISYYNKENVLKFNAIDGSNAYVYSGKYYDESQVTVPSSVNGKVVTAIGKDAFKNKKNLTSITIPSTVTTIDNEAFYGCVNLQSLTIQQETTKQRKASQITKIGDRAFYGCTSLKYIDFSTVNSIGNEAFNGCISLEEVKLTSNTTSVGRGAFGNCINLKSIIIEYRPGELEGFDSYWRQELSDKTVVKIGYAINLNYNNATDNYDKSNELVFSGESYVLPIPTRQGYSFDGWYTSEDYDVKLTDAQGKSIIDYDKTESIEAYAKWNANINMIIFNSNGGSGVMSEQYMATDTQDYLKPCDFTRAGYQFVGWKEVSSSKTYADKALFSMGASANNVLLAQWQANTNTLKFNANGGDGSMSDMSIKTDLSGMLSRNIFTRSGYEFSGWSTTQNGAVEYKDMATYTMGVDAEYTLYAVWSIKNYSITYTLNGGSVSGNPSTYNIQSQDIVIKNPTKAGYTFLGWSGTNLVGSTNTEVIIASGSYGNVALTANWQANTNALKFDANGGEGSMDDMSIKTDASANLTKNNFTRRGYTFMGWTTQQGGTVKYNDGAKYTMGTDAQYTLYAVWQIKTYYITYNLNGGNVYGNPTSYNINTQEIEIKNPTKAGYTFLGWSGTSLNGNENTQVCVAGGRDGDVSLTANWQANINSIVFHANGGVGEMLDQQMATDSSEKLDQNAFVRKGYKFEGWATSENGSKRYDDKANYTMGTNAQYDLYAVWSIIRYSITYTLNGGSVIGNPSVYYVTSSDISINNPTRAGYTFTGWTGTDLTNSEMNLVVESGSIGDREYNANWQANINNLHFMSNGGNGNMSAQQIATDATVNISQNQYTRKGYQFKGWSLAPGGSKAYDDVASYTMGAQPDYYLYAIWQIETYSITYVLDGGNVSGNMNRYTVDTAEFTLNTPTKKGYEFKGWSGTDIDNLAMSVTIAAGSIGDRQYQANWELIEYTIIYVLNDGIVSGNPENYDVNTATFTLFNPTKVGYTFKGWQSEEGTSTKVVISQGSTGNRTYTALFEANTYSITLKLNGGKCDITSLSVVYDQEYTLPQPTYFGHDFLGWYSKDDILFESGTWQTDEDTTLTAKWQHQDTILISTADELSMIVYDLSANYLLVRDIDLANVEWNIIGDESSPFKGTFDGGNHTISKYKISKTADYVGLFGENAGTIKNLNITEANITSGTTGAGALIGLNTGTVSNCSISGKVTSSAAYVGGMVGRANIGTHITSCDSQVAVKVVINSSENKSSANIGGLIGYVVGGVDSNVIIEQSCAESTISGNVKNSKIYGGAADLKLGGLIGYASYVKIDDCYFQGNISGYLEAYSKFTSTGTGDRISCTFYCYMGGLVGGMDCSSVNNSYANLGITEEIVNNHPITGTIAVSNQYIYIGGLAGRLDELSEISNSFSYVYEKLGVITGGDHTNTLGTHDVNYGGLVGTSSSVITNSYRYSDDECDVMLGTPTTLTNFKSPNFIIDTLRWDATIWDLQMGEFPKLRQEE